ncbi:helix-turn-helix domain-containing protein [Polaribacter sp. R77954]|uniref:helix-turn-helix domain-containing protein n=1 Tax=Polaribacter sp. R77954 TaxID=3093870 RepID=UPI0037C5C115
MEKKLISIRKRIKLERTKKEYTQYYMSCRLSTTQVAYHNLENGKSNLKIDTLLRIATILEIDVKDFFDFEELEVV